MGFIDNRNGVMFPANKKSRLAKEEDTTPDKFVRADTSLISAVKSKKLDAVKKSLQENPELLNQTNGYRRTPLHYAARMGLKEIARFLLEQNDIDITLKDIEGKIPEQSARVEPYQQNQEVADVIAEYRKEQEEAKQQSSSLRCC